MFLFQLKNKQLSFWYFLTKEGGDDYVCNVCFEYFPITTSRNQRGKCGFFPFDAVKEWPGIPPFLIGDKKFHFHTKRVHRFPVQQKTYFLCVTLPCATHFLCFGKKYAIFLLLREWEQVSVLSLIISDIFCFILQNEVCCWFCIRFGWL